MNEKVEGEVIQRSKQNHKCRTLQTHAFCVCVVCGESDWVKEYAARWRSNCISAEIITYIRAEQCCTTASHAERYATHKTLTRLGNSPDESDAGQNLQIGAAGRTVQGGDTLDGHARGHIIAGGAVAEDGRKRVGRLALLLLIIHYARGGQSGGEQHGGNDEHFHF